MPYCKSEQALDLIRALPIRASSSLPFLTLFLPRRRRLGLLRQRRDVVFDISYLIPIRFDLHIHQLAYMLSITLVAVFLLPHIPLTLLCLKSPGMMEKKTNIPQPHYYSTAPSSNAPCLPFAYSIDRPYGGRSSLSGLRRLMGNPIISM